MSEVLIRCDASSSIGFGHLSRSIALAQAFREDCGVNATLLMLENPTALSFARNAGVRVQVLPPTPIDTANATRAALAHARALVLDFRGDLDPAILAEAAARRVVIATIDDPTPRRLLANLAFYPPIPQVREWSWSGFSGELLAGWDWVVIRRDLGPPRTSRIEPPPRLLITMGGSDPHGLSSIVLDALEQFGKVVHTTLIVGPANLQRATLGARAASLHVRCTYAPERFADLMRNTDIAVVSFGVTACELAALRVPSLYLCLTDDHAKSASIFEQSGLGRFVGTYPDISVHRTLECISDAVDAYSDFDSWVHGLENVLDGMGASRVAHRIMARLRSMTT